VGVKFNCLSNFFRDPLNTIISFNIFPIYPGSILRIPFQSSYIEKFELASSRIGRRATRATLLRSRSFAHPLDLRPKLLNCRLNSAIGGQKTRKFFKELFSFVFSLKRRNRWTQQEIAFNCPIAPLKKAISIKTESTKNLAVKES